MKNTLQILFIVLIFNFFWVNVFAQESPILEEKEECATDFLHNRLLQNDPLYQSKFNEFQDLVASGNIVAPKAPLLKVPVVFHVLHLGEVEGTGTNISKEQIYSALASLNDAYRGLSPYSSSGVDMEIEFCLASQDPFGNATTGINRVDASGTSDYSTNGITTSGSNNEVTIKALSKWSNTDYYNIWVVSEIDGNNAGGGTQGYAYFPGAGSNVDGTVIMYNSLGYDPTASRCLNVKSYTNYNITLIHELGHGFGLYHTFEGDSNGTACPVNGNCSTDGDQICDTPPHDRSSGCPTGTNNLCGTLVDNHMHNFMDYSSDDCQTEFTADQKTRARSFLTGSRPGLLTSAGCTPVAAAISDLSSECSSTSGCVGSTIQFYDLSDYNADSWSWSFPGGTPNTSTAKNPVITYSVAGTYDVILQSTNSFGTGTTKTNTDFITIYDVPTAACIPGIQNVGFYGYSFSNVSFGNINNTTPASANGYSDFSCDQVANFTEGLTYNLSITVGNSGSQSGFYNCYIDYDDNGTFAAGESVLSGSTVAGSGYQTVSQNVTIPLTAVQNNLLRMRVINDQFNLSGPCDNLFTGEAEDYGIYISPVVALPVELINFSAELNDEIVTLNWQTATELNNDYFTIERSANGTDWKEISKVRGAGNSSEELNYTSLDNQPLSGISYYRLRQTDFDGQSSYSQVRSVNAKNLNREIKIFPNPALDHITINGSMKELEEVNIFNTLGQNVTTRISVIKKTDTQVVLDLSSLNSGIYYIKTKTTANRITKL